MLPETKAKEWVYLVEKCECVCVLGNEGGGGGGGEEVCLRRREGSVGQRWG